ncbi:class I SAM-dependent methyltransferase [Candidatus Rariloculus sp.]|uniref:class I SAM-dependent methyltransferase n=1 Tax=Candidatus Rariloculus sp. TaxID=3101265 RepID=UPI003D14C561
MTPEGSRRPGFFWVVSDIVMNENTEWWQEFFTRAWGEIQAQGYPVEQTGKEVDFLVSALALGRMDQVLDVACGIGQHSIELARRGYDATGIDFNRSALDIAARSAFDAGVQPRFVELDMRQLEAHESYDAAFSYWTSFGYFSDEKNLDVASRIAAALKPGGRLLIDTLVTESLFPVFRQRHWAWADQARAVRMLQECTWEPMDGRVETAHSSLRVYSYRELHALLATAGFCSFRGLVTGTDEPFGLGSARLSLVAQKADG